VTLPEFSLDGQMSNTQELAWENSAFLWGESVFTTFLMENQGYSFLRDHWSRLEQSVDYQFNENISEKTKQSCFDFLKKHQSLGKKKVRLTFFKDLEGVTHWLGSVEEYGNMGVESRELLLLEHPHFANSRPSFVKSSQYSEVLRVERKAGKKIIWHDQHGEILEGTFANILFAKGEHFYVPRNRNGILYGITLKQFLAMLKDLGKVIIEEKIYDENLAEFDQAYLTSSLKGPREIIKVGEYTFGKGQSFSENWIRWKGQYKEEL
jgi:branched-subunit amino acid aminotransferase/4-amino-4-deoxychorismate lyase